MRFQEAEKSSKVYQLFLIILLDFDLKEAVYLKERTKTGGGPPPPLDLVGSKLLEMMGSDHPCFGGKRNQEMPA